MAAIENEQHRLPPEASVEASSPRARGLVARLIRSERGQGVVEFAMILPLLGALIFALIDFGKALYYYIDLTHVANEGARIAAVSQATMPNGATSLKGYLCTQFGSGSELNTGSASVNKAVVAVSYDNNNSKNVGDPVTVSVSTTYHWIPFWNIGTMNISSSATMRIENPPSATGTTVITGGTCP